MIALVLVSGWCWPHRMSLEAFFLCSFFFFLNYLRRIGVNSSLSVWYNLPMKPSGDEILFVGNYFITDSVLLLVLVCLYFLFLPSWFFLHYSFIYHCEIGHIKCRAGVKERTIHNPISGTLCHTVYPSKIPSEPPRGFFRWSLLLYRI